MTAWGVLVTVLGGIVLICASFFLGRRLARADAAPIDPEPVRSAPPPPPTPAAELLAGMPIASIVIDSADRVVMANEAAQCMGLVQGGRIVVRPLLELSHRTRSAGTAEADLQLPVALGRPGSLIVRSHGVLLADRLVGLILIDVTEQHRVEAVRRDFVANVSHELKTPIGAITLLGDAIQDAADDQDAVRRFALSMQKEGKRLTTLIGELIELSRLQGAEPSSPPAEVRVVDVVTESSDRVRLAAEAKDITLIADGDNDLTVHAIAPQLVMAVTNLLSNAIAYSPDRTTVALTYRLDGRDVEIVIKDEGIGIAPRDLDRIFERFYRVDQARSRATGGTGLGLAIVKHIATNHGGSIRVWSGEGAGSTFSLRIPVSVSDDASAGARPDHSLVSDTSLADPEIVR